MTTTQPSPRIVTYAYDANQHRFSQSDGISATTYVDDLYERRVDAVTGEAKNISYVFAEGQRIAQVIQSGSQETLVRLYSDALGSVTGVDKGQAHQAFSPWGERLQLASTTQSSIADVTPGFTDQEHDDGVGLINMRGRVYDPATRTFLTPDPIVGSLRISGWNKYAYVSNNPLKYVDPSGLEEVQSGDMVTAGDADYTISTDEDGTTRYNWYLSSDAQDDALSPSSGKGTFDAGGCSDGGGCSDASVSPDAMTPQEREWEAAKDGLYNAYIDQLQQGLQQGFNLTPFGSVLSGSVDLSALKAPIPNAERERAQYDFAHDGSSLLVAALGTLAGGDLTAGEKALGEAAEATAARTFTSADPLVADLANAIEKAYPGHVAGVNVPMYNAAGQLATDADILLRNAIIQVKSGSGAGLTSQLLRTQAVTDLPVIGYGPNLGGSLVRGIQAGGGLVTRDPQLLIDVIAP